MKLRFECKNCGCEKLEEIMVNVTQSSVIDIIEQESEETVYVDYAEVSHDGGEVSRYQCSECGQVIINEFDDIIPCDENELAEWLQENVKQEVKKC